MGLSPRTPDCSRRREADSNSSPPCPTAVQPGDRFRAKQNKTEQKNQTKPKQSLFFINKIEFYCNKYHSEIPGPVLSHCR